MIVLVGVETDDGRLSKGTPRSLAPPRASCMICESELVTMFEDVHLAKMAFAWRFNPQGSQITGPQMAGGSHG